MQMINVDVKPEEYDLFLEANDAVGQLEELDEDSDSDNEEAEAQALESPPSPSGATTPNTTRETTPNPPPCT